MRIRIGNAMSDKGEDINNFNEVISSIEILDNPITWKKHGIYKLWCISTAFIRGPRHKEPKPKDSRFKFIAEQLISTLPEKADSVVITTVSELLHQHRTVEDTEARRRLEHWACGTIIIYLLAVLCLVILNGLSRIIWPDIFDEEGFISDTVMYVILSTTTINIIGLGIIVLEGHFRQKKNNHFKRKKIRKDKGKVDI